MISRPGGLSGKTLFGAAVSSALFAVVAVAPSAQAEDPPTALATIGMIADVASNVAGSCVTVDQLMASGVDPHLYRASASDVQAFQQADAIFYSGYSLEGQLGEVLEKLSESKPTVAVSPAAIPPADLITTQDVYGIDPHLWMDVSLWSKIAPTIAETLAEIAPDCAGDLKDRAEAYQTELSALHGWISDSVATIPQEQRILVTAHDAFAYYGRAYGIEVAGIQGISTESEAAVADIREMVDIVVARQVPAVFIESTINPRTIQAVIDSAAAEGQAVGIGGELFSDAMGAPDTAGGTYIGMLFENTMTLVQALGGEPMPLPAELQSWAEEWNVEIAERP
ncbi:MAG: zinc ABC transporter substrate-binding protein [Pseudomonadota bacterium]